MVSANVLEIITFCVFCIGYLILLCGSILETSSIDVTFEEDDKHFPFGWVRWLPWKSIVSGVLIMGLSFWMAGKTEGHIRFEHKMIPVSEIDNYKAKGYYLDDGAFRSAPVACNSNKECFIGVVREVSDDVKVF